MQPTATGAGAGAGASTGACASSEGTGRVSPTLGESLLWKSYVVLSLKCLCGGLLERE